MKKLSLFFGLYFITSALFAEELDLKPIMPQQQLLTQKDVLQAAVKNAWDKCLNALNAKFSGLAEKNPADEHVISINFEFEKQPKTNQNILFIKNTVRSIIGGEPISLIKFDQSEQRVTLKTILARMMTNALVELLLKDVSEPLDWCTCTAEYKRITLALLMVNEIREKFPNKNQHIVYMSFASGSLLQDYVIMSELLLSHTNILVNLIDLEYPDIPALAKKNLKAEEPYNLHMLEMKTQQESADMIDSFKVKIAQIISERRSSGEDYHFGVNLYQNAYEYIARAQTNHQEKSNILVMVDPSIFSFAIADFPSLANVINVWIDQEEKPVFTLYLPRHHGAHLYQALEVVDSKTMQYLHNQLLQLIVNIGASKNYTPNLTKALLNKAIPFNKQITDEVLANDFPQLMQRKADLKGQALQEGAIEDSLLLPLTPIKLGDVPVLLSWGTDAHISFQDLVWDALASNAIVYQLYAVDPKEQSDKNNKIIKIIPETYKKEDVVIPNAGRGSEDKYKRIQ